MKRNGCNDARGESRTPRVNCLDRVWMLVGPGPNVMYHPAASNAHDAWVNGVNFWNSPSQYADPDLGFNEKKERLYADGWRAQRVVIGRAI